MAKFLRHSLILLALIVGLASAQTVNVAWPYQLPPDGHFNTYGSARISLGFYQDFMEPPLAVYMWADGVYEGMAAESFGFDDRGNYTVTLKDGYTWSDGTPITSADLIATFYTGYIIGWSVWDNLDAVVAVDSHTAKFIMASPSVATERLIMTENLRPASVYGSFAMKAAALKAMGHKGGDADFDAALEELTNFRPETFVSGGPFVLLAENIGDARIKLVKNPGGVAADTVAFDEAIVWNGETETVFPLLQDGELWYATHGFSPAQEEAHINKGLDIIRNPYYSGPAIYFNNHIEVLANPVLHQAIAYAIDREENGFVSLGQSGVAVEYMAGFSDNLLKGYVSEDVLDSLNTYDYDPEKAAELMASMGYSKGDDGIWQDADGKDLAFELIFPAEFADWSAAAENAAQALNDFGIKITARGVQFQQQLQDVYNGDYELAIRNWGAGSPFPYQSYLVPYRQFNGQGELAGEGGGGMGFNTMVSYSGGEMDVLEQTIASSEGTDRETQGAIVAELAKSFNELLPIVPLWERYGNNPINRAQLDAPEGNDPIYLNAGADHFMPYMILTGKVRPAGQ
ncbi:MAG: ABC transporter substrate-binding protein [Deinococcales bacterium]